MGQGTLDEDGVADLFGGCGAVDPRLVPAGAALQARPGEVADAGAAPGHPLRPLQEGALRRETVGIADVVGVHPGQEPTPGLGARPLEGGHDPPGGLGEYGDAPIPSGPRRQDLRGGVPGSVVHRQDLEVRVGLGLQGGHRLLQVCRPVPDGEEDGDGWSRAQGRAPRFRRMWSET